MARLEDPLRIGGVTLRNRLYRAPVLEGAGAGPEAAQIYADTFEANARGGVGLIIQGNSCITDEGRSSSGMSIVAPREQMLALASVPAAVHRWGGRIFIQIGHAGIFALEGWHAEFAKGRRAPLIAASRPPIHVRPALRGVPVHVLTTAEVRDLVDRFGRVAASAREAGYDGIQLASSNAKLVHQFLSPFYNRRNDEYGGTLRNRARVLEDIATAVRRAAGDDFPLTVKIPMAEDAPPFAPRTTFEQGIELCRMAEGFGYDAITPVGLSVFPHASLCRGGYPGDILETKSIKTRFEEALGGSRTKMAVLRWGYRRAAQAYPFEPVWNRAFFSAAKRNVSIPVFAVGGIRSRDECDDILGSGDADLIGIGRPFYAEPDLAARLLQEGGRALCEASNRCVPAQQLGLKARCYNSRVTRRVAERESSSQS
ncbi:MAG TPA: NADH:flavin oxidoreductase [Actinomycetota bacterium]|nr:NADH:flavin oxidoreductase [Actinomycetota bacterium]